MPKAIGNNQHMQLVGLLTVANVYTRRLEDVKLAICDVLGIEDGKGTDGDHVSDAVWGYPTDDPVGGVKQLLDRLNVEVLK